MACRDRSGSEVFAPALFILIFRVKKIFQMKILSLKKTVSQTVRMSVKIAPSQ